MKWLALFTALTICCVFSGCGANQVQTDGYQDKEAGFSIDFPAFWKKSESRTWNKTNVTYADPSNIADISIVITKGCPNLSPEGLIARAKSSAQAEYQNFRVIETGEKFIAGKNWAKLHMYFEKEGITFKSTHYYFREGSRLSILACDAEGDAFSEFEDDFNRAIISFQFE